MSLAYIEEDKNNCKGCRKEGKVVEDRCGITQQQLSASVGTNLPLLDTERKCIDCGHKYGQHPAGVVQGGTNDQLLKKLVLDVGIMDRKLAPIDNERVITPSQFTGATDFNQFTDKIPLDSVEETELKYQRLSNDDNVYDWPFKKDQRKETESYQHLVEYLNNRSDLKNRYNDRSYAYAVGSKKMGFGGNSSLLFKERIYSLRESIPTTEQGRKNVIYQFTVQGETDIVITDKKHDGKIKRCYVLCVIEVKKPDDLLLVRSNLNPSAFVELLGFNADNPYHSPPVICTDLLNNHIVYWIENPQESPDLIYEVHFMKFEYFSQTIDFIISYKVKDNNSLLTRPSCTSYFFRGPLTPPPTPDLKGQEHPAEKNDERIISDPNQSIKLFNLQEKQKMDKKRIN